jgi:hypothetical protein
MLTIIDNSNTNYNNSNTIICKSKTIVGGFRVIIQPLTNHKQQIKIDYLAQFSPTKQNKTKYLPIRYKKSP